MVWERFAASTIKKPPMADDECEISAVGRAGGKGVSIAVTFGRAKLADLRLRLGLCWVERGHDVHHGQLRIEMTKDGNRNIGSVPRDRFGRGRVVLPGEFLGVIEKHPRESVRATRGPDGSVYVTLPEWARAYGKDKI